MFCWPCITVYRYSETNVMHFLFSLLRIQGLYRFRALLAHPQETLHKPHLVYCVRVMSVGCTRIEVHFNIGAAQAALGIMYACYVSWLHQGWSLHQFRRRTSGTCYIECVLCQLAAPELKLNSIQALHKQHLYWVRVMSVGCTRTEVHFNPGAANWHNTQAIYLSAVVQHLLRMSK
jgi:hypothetical protein